MKCKLVFIILDGLGIGINKKGNPVFDAKPKCFNYLFENFSSTKLIASEERVGLFKNQSGNSEVGHLTIGSGKKILMGKRLVDQAFKQNKSKLVKLLKEVKSKHQNVHLIGLVSTGNIHASIEHLYELIKICNQCNIKPVLDLISDGRDCKDKEFLTILKKIDSQYIKTKKAVIGSIAGRYYSLDRNENFKRTLLSYNEMINIAQDNIEPIAYIEQSYKSGISDELLSPKSFNNQATKITENDFLFFFNYRSDRMRQLVHLFTRDYLDYKFHVDEPIDVNIMTLTDYNLKGVNHIFANFLKPDVYLGKELSRLNLKQLRITETEKYAHLTFFLDVMNKEKPKGCDTILIPSPNVSNFEKTPAMSAKYITKAIFDNIDKYDVILVNYANADMVAHTGNYKACLKAISTLDKQLKNIYQKIHCKFNIPLIITADHGNIEKNYFENGIIYTSHTTNLVPFIIVDKKQYHLDNGADLTNVAATIIEFLGFDANKTFNKSLFKVKNVSSKE